MRCAQLLLCKVSVVTDADNGIGIGSDSDSDNDRDSDIVKIFFSSSLASCRSREVDMEI